MAKNMALGYDSFPLFPSSPHNFHSTNVPNAVICNTGGWYITSINATVQRDSPVPPPTKKQKTSNLAVFTEDFNLNAAFVGFYRIFS
jgi:hypothetical protein